MTGRDFLTFAKTLYKSEDEAARRSAVSRAYYALFHEVKSIVDSVGIRVDREAHEHKRMARYFKEAGIPKAKQIGQGLEDLREIRNDADYDLITTKFSKNTSALQCALAEKFCNMLDSINGKELKRGLVAYAKLINEL